MKVLLTGISIVLAIAASQSGSGMHDAPEFGFIQQLDYCRNDEHIYYPEKDVICFERLHGYPVLLDVLREPPLTGAADRHITYYRFFWLRTFHRPVSVRIEIDSRRIGSELTHVATIYFKTSDGAGGYHPGKLDVSSERRLTRDELKRFLRVFRDVDVCTAPPPQEPHTDGSRWIFEYRAGNTYCAIGRQSPHGNPYEAAGLFMLQLAGFQETARDPIY